MQKTQTLQRLDFEKMNLKNGDLKLRTNDWLAEWSKALVLGTSLFGGVGSNPTAAKKLFYMSLVSTLKIGNHCGKSTCHCQDGRVV